MIIFLIRHGQSYGNLLGTKKSIIKGSKDNTSLTNHGKKQIEVISKSFVRSGIKVDKIFSSPLKRAMQSAKIFANYFCNQKILIDDNIKEINFGDLERKSFEDVKSKYFTWWLKYQLDRFNTPFPNGESKKDLINRVKIFIKNNLKKDGVYVIFTHEEVIRAFLSIFYGDEQFFFSRGNLKTIKNGKVNSVFFDGNNYLIYQINSSSPYELKINQYQAFKNFLVKNNLKILYCQKNNSYSDNLVLTVYLENNNKKIIKLIPKYKEKNLQKEIYLCDVFKKLNLPIPSCYKVEKYSNFYVYFRDFIDKSLGDDFLCDNAKNKLLAKSMGEFLKLIHQKTIFLKNDEKFKKLTDFYDADTWPEKFVNPWLINDLKTLQKINFSKSEIKKISTIFESSKKIINQINIGLIYYDFHPKNFTVELVDNKFILNGLWDFENVFWGDTYFDLAYTIKLSFFKKKQLISKFLNGYFRRRLKKYEKIKIYFYLLMITTGSITYKLKKGGNWQEEVKNLQFFLKNYLINLP